MKKNETTRHRKCPFSSNCPVLQRKGIPHHVHCGVHHERKSCDKERKYFREVLCPVCTIIHGRHLIPPKWLKSLHHREIDAHPYCLSWQEENEIIMLGEPFSCNQADAFGMVAQRKLFIHIFKMCENTAHINSVPTPVYLCHWCIDEMQTLYGVKDSNLQNIH